MPFWVKSLQIFNCLCEHGTQSVRWIAHKTGFSKSSVHRFQQALAWRGRHPESWLWETEEGRQWLTRLVVATLYTFGLKRGVGLETMSEFFARLRLERHMGCSASALRGVLHAVETAILETPRTWEQEARATGEVREIIGAVDETFLEHMMLVFQDVPTGYLLFEDIADDRTYTTWKTLVDKRLAALGTEVLYLVSDRAKALIGLAEKGLGCLSMPDFFHCMYDLGKSYSLALARKLRQAQKALKTAEDALAKHPGLPPAAPNDSGAQAAVEASRAEVQRWEEVRSADRHHLETLSLSLHPFTLVDATAQTSEQVASRLHAEVQAIEALAERHQLPARQGAMKKVRKQLPGLAALVDFWWEGVSRDLDHAAISPMWRRWARESLLPLVYWEHQVAHTRCARRKAKIRQALEAAHVAFGHHALTQCLPPQALKEWHEWATDRVRTFQRASSAVEGRNGYLAQLHRNQRGLPKHRYKVWTVVHNFDGRAADGTTPACRFFRRTFPDLFETVLSHIEVLPRARQRKDKVALSL
jgi:hypothetical protein